MPTVVLLPREANVADDADKPAARDQSAKAVIPDPVQLGEETVVVLDMAHLSLRVAIFLEGPIGGRGKDQMKALGLDVVHKTSVTKIYPMVCGNPLNRLSDQSQKFLILCDPRDVGLRVLERKNLGWDELL
jgi:hypothetical protein